MGGSRRLKIETSLNWRGFGKSHVRGKVLPDKNSLIPKGFKSSLASLLSYTYTYTII